MLYMDTWSKHLSLYRKKLEILKIDNLEHCSHKMSNYEQDVQISYTSAAFW